MYTTIIKEKLDTDDTVRFVPGPSIDLNSYIIYLKDQNNVVQVHLSLMSLMQLRKRIDAALDHLITH